VGSKIKIGVFLLIVLFFSSAIMTSCKSSKKDCDCPTFGEKAKKNKKTKYKRPK